MIVAIQIPDLSKNVVKIEVAIATDEKFTTLFITSIDNKTFLESFFSFISESTPKVLLSLYALAFTSLIDINEISKTDKNAEISKSITMITNSKANILFCQIYWFINLCLVKFYISNKRIKQGLKFHYFPLIISSIASPYLTIFAGPNP